MRVKHHAAISVGIAALTWLGTRSAAATLAAGLSGSLMDVDHLPALLRRGFRAARRGENPFRSLWNLISLDNRELGRRYNVTLPESYTPSHVFHQVELAPLLPILIWVLGYNDAALGIAVGMASHLAGDMIGNRPPLKSMSLLARLLMRR